MGIYGDDERKFLITLDSRRVEVILDNWGPDPDSLQGPIVQQIREQVAVPWSETRPCPVCGEQCSGCLEDLAGQHEALRELLSYCKTQDGRYMKPYEAYRDVATKLAAILDGEQ